ncbi:MULTISPECIES: helix-hairpin-helix domain-containing protein [Haladaptatus]|nr:MULTISPECIES: helix-hairpin-helix domain-containing protein [Haladaptatus]SHK10137.1 Helix-hairpin-helix domain-containing protein [Haladaptatus paucihalophilus DX253]
MKVICENGLTLDCKGYKAVDSGVILMDDEDRKNVVGFVPSEHLEYVVSEDVFEENRELLGVPEPEIESPEELDDQLDRFEREVAELEKNLDEQTEAMSEEEVELREEVEERRDHLQAHVESVQSQLSQVIDRAEHLRRLSESEEAVETEAGDADATAEAGASSAVEIDETSEDVEELRHELDDRLSAIEDRLETIAETGEASDESDDGDKAEAEETEGEEGAEMEAEGDGQHLERIDGLGDTYRSRLENAGIDSLEDLASAEPDDVAEAANVPQTRAEGWVEEASEEQRSNA